MRLVFVYSRMRGCYSFFLMWNNDYNARAFVISYVENDYNAMEIMFVILIGISDVRFGISDFRC